MTKKNRTSRSGRSKQPNPTIAKPDSIPTLPRESEYADGTATEDPGSVGPDENDLGRDANQQIEPNSPIDQGPYLPPPSIGKYLLWKRRREHWVPIITVVVSLVGLILIGAQVFIYDQQRRIMNNQVSVAERNLRISERAYVGVASIKADLAEGEIVIMLENLGRLPAKTIQVTANAYLIGTKRDGYDNVLTAGEVQLFPGSFQMRLLSRLANTIQKRFKPFTTIRVFCI